MFTAGQDLRARAYGFARRIVRLTDDLGRRPGAARLIARQLLSAGTAVGANLEEAAAAHSRADFICRVNIARREARESLYWLKLLADCGLVPTARLRAELAEADELTAILTAIVRNARRKATAR